MICLVSGLVVALHAVALAAHWLFNPPAWWPVPPEPADHVRSD